MKIIFFGTPEYAVPLLETFVNSNHQVVAVVSQPDRPKGRSKKILPTPVKQVALKYNIPVYQYEKIRKDDISEILKIDADLIVTCAYGQILGSNVLFAKKYGVINFHGSLLPKYRGASPIQWALINGEKTTGITVLKSGIGMDDGPVLKSIETKIEDNDNAITLFDKLSELNTHIAIEVLDLIEAGKANFIEQNNELASYCTLLNSDMANLSFSDSCKKIVGLIKGLAIWPTAHISIDGVYFKLYNAKIYSQENYQMYKNGEVVIANNKQGLIIKCNDGLIEITELLPINSKKMSAKSYLNGKTIKVGSIVE